MRHNKRACALCRTHRVPVTTRQVVSADTGEIVTQRVFNVTRIDVRDRHAQALCQNKERLNAQRAQRHEDTSRAIRLEAYRTLTTKQLRRAKILR